jgi:hypothetical protein
MTRADSERLARIETKLDAVIERGRDHEKRIRAVEVKQWFASGAAAIVGSIATLFAKSRGLA